MSRSSAETRAPLPQNAPAEPRASGQIGLPELREACQRILTQGDLASKLSPCAPDATSASFESSLETSLDASFDASFDAAPNTPSRPARGPGLRMQSGSDRLPRPGQLRSPEQRIACLQRFAHHELQAVELFAWAILRWPDVPSDLHRAWWAALVDEQRHCRLYLERLEAHGGTFETDDHSDYFWRQVPAIEAAPSGPKAFLSAMGLTLEQANLDFTLTYRDGFAEAGDAESAAVCQLVHDEEIGHVALAGRWLARLEMNDAGSSFTSTDGDEGPDVLSSKRTDLDRYLESVPFPLGPARAKGKRFDKKARKRAGLSEALIEHVRVARSTAELAHATSSRESADDR